MQETMGEDEVAGDFRRGMDLKITRRQRAKMGVHFLLAQFAGQRAADLLGQQFALLFLGADEFRAAGQAPAWSCDAASTSSESLKSFHNLSLVASESANVWSVSKISVSAFCTCLAKARMTAGSSRSRRWEVLAMSR